jgi:DNA repair exonuclease SbcCD ATPase subunit
MLGKLGDLFVTLKADSSQFMAGMKQAEAQGQATAQKLNEANESTVRGFQKSVRAVTSFIGSITAAIGVATLFYNIGKQVREVWDDALKSATDRANEFSIALLTTEPNKLLADTEKRLQAIDGELAKVTENLDSWGGAAAEANARGRIEALEKEKKLLESQAKAYREQIKATKDDIERRREAREQERIQAESDERQKADYYAWLAGQEQRFKEAREAVDTADGVARDKREQDAKERADDERRISDQAAELIDAIADIQRRHDEARLALLKQQTAEILRQMQLFADLQQRQVGGFGFGGMEATLKAIRGDLQSIRGVIR